MTVTALLWILKVSLSLRALQTQQLKKSTEKKILYLNPLKMVCMQVAAISLIIDTVTAP